MIETYALPVLIVYMSVLKSVFELVLSPFRQLIVAIEQIKILIKVKTFETTKLFNNVGYLSWRDAAPR